ncbi:zinc finger protein 729-like [Nylanderia fulva]|uniref:zinc finger protein 729-like n=1 Tax=Nylanderia fulva TaxID=613905 RepID=UPI0010FAF686|nr:zinc finger protein 729-like [Nylanderia fulva]XP_029166267.1 zinc finger protein 729-like [Nylanderia fulva]
MQDGGADPSRQMDSDPTGLPKNYKCHFCGKTFYFKGIFENHLLSHGTGSEHDMPEERSDPSRQMASGSTGDNMQGEGVGSSRQRDSNPTGQPETYKCDFCAQTFDSSEILCNHLYYHNLENHPCYVCELKFISYSELRKHCILVHSDGSLKCDKCGKFFAQFDYLIRHKKRCHNNGKYFCNIYIIIYSCSNNMQMTEDIITTTIF